MLSVIFRNLLAQLRGGRKRTDAHAYAAALSEAIQARARGDLPAAAALLGPLVAGSPDDANLRLTYAGVLDALGRHGAAESEYRRVLEQSPGWAIAHVNYAAFLAARSEWPKAFDLLCRAIDLDPQLVDARMSLAWVLSQLQKFTEAIAQCDAALGIDPDSRSALALRAALLHRGGDAEAARAAQQQRFESGAGDGAAIARALALPGLLDSRGHIDEVRQRLANQLEALLARELHVGDPMREIGVTHFYLAYHGRDDRALHERIAAVHLHACPSLAYVSPHCSRAARGAGRIRVGVLSSFLASHSIGRVTQGLIEQLDRERFEVCALSLQDPADGIAKDIAAHAERWVTVPRSLEAAREAIAGLELDVLLYPDIGMDPVTYYLAYARLARVQCTTWGHPVTSGIPAIDYFLSTDYFDTPSAEAQYSEKLVRLRDAALPGYYRRPATSGATPPPLPGQEDGGRVYFCPQALFKFHPDFDAIVADILRADRGGRVVLVEQPGTYDHIAARLKARLQASAPDVFDRIVFITSAPTREGYLQRLRAAEVVLDTVHYCGGNTSLEAISAGSLVVTLPSELNRGRQTYGFYRRIEFTETVASTPQDYAERAVRIATDRDLRIDLQRSQESRVHALFEDAGAVAQIERFFEDAVARAPLH